MIRPGIELLVSPPSAIDLVLLAHGGEVRSMEDAHDWRAAILRMWPFAAAARDAVPAAAIGLVRYRYRGWNGPAAHPAEDLRSVLEGLPDRIRRVALVGHSMGGRAVMAAGNHPKVAGILGLAPWLPPGEPVALEREPSRVVVLAHGSQDRITDPRLTATYARRLRAAGLPVGLLTVENDSHAMLRRYADWNELVRRFTRHTLGTGDPVPDDCSAVLSTDAGRVDPLPRWSRPASTSAAIRDITRARLRLRAGHRGWAAGRAAQ